MFSKILDKLDYICHLKVKKMLHDFKWDDKPCGDLNCPFCRGKN